MTALKYTKPSTNAVPHKLTVHDFIKTHEVTVQKFADLIWNYYVENGVAPVLDSVIAKHGQNNTAITFYDLDLAAKKCMLHNQPPVSPSSMRLIKAGLPLVERKGLAPERPVTLKQIQSSIAAHYEAEGTLPDQQSGTIKHGALALTNFTWADIYALAPKGWVTGANPKTHIRDIKSDMGYINAHRIFNALAKYKPETLKKVLNNKTDIATLPKAKLDSYNTAFKNDKAYRLNELVSRPSTVKSLVDFCRAAGLLKADIQPIGAYFTKVQRAEAAQRRRDEKYEMCRRVGEIARRMYGLA